MKDRVKKTQNKRKKQPAVQRVSPPRMVRLTPEGASLALYHAGLSDPFSSPPIHIPYGTRQGTYTHKLLMNYVGGTTDTSFKIRFWAQSADEWKLSLYAGATLIRNIHMPSGHARMVGAAIRVTDIGRNDTLGGLATLVNDAGIPNFKTNSEVAMFRKTVTAFYKPIFATDYIWFSGNGEDANEGYGNVDRTVSVTLDAAVDTKSFVEFVVLLEADSQYPDSQSSGNYIVNKKIATPDAGPITKSVAIKAKFIQRAIDMSNHVATKGAQHHKRVLEGVKAAAASGATAMGITHAAKTGTFSKFLGLGEATEVELAAASADAIPVIESAAEFLPLMLL
jgi:hypothetical protein